MAEPRYNTYIGARYIPLFCGDWDNDLEYEPLSIVSYEGNSYTSRTFVPTGVAITNTDYWFVSGNYNQQVEQYRQQVVALSNNVGNVQNLTTEDKSNIVNAINEDTTRINDLFGFLNGVLVQFRYISSAERIDIICNELFNTLSIISYNETLEITNNSDIDIHYDSSTETLYIIKED